jgi:hypothetical protein
MIFSFLAPIELAPWQRQQIDALINAEIADRELGRVISHATEIRVEVNAEEM